MSKFLYQYAEALLCFDCASHRIEDQLASVAKVMEFEARFFHTFGVMLIQLEYNDPDLEHNVRLIKPMFNGLHISGYTQVHEIYRLVINDKMYPTEARALIYRLLIEKSCTSPKFGLVLSFTQSMLICIIAFGGTTADALVAGVMGFCCRFLLLRASKTALSSSGSEVFTAALVSLVARMVSTFSNQQFCFSAISSAGVVSLLPGYLICSSCLFRSCVQVSSLTVTRSARSA